MRAFARALARPSSPRSPAAPARLRFAYTSEGAPARYRVHHQVEQARLAGMPAGAVRITEPERLYELADIDLLVLHRLPLGPRTAALLLAARRRRIVTLFDADDLTWDVRQRSYEFLDRHYPPATVRAILRTARRTLALMRRADALLLATPFLAALAAGATGRPAHVNLNAVSHELAAHSEAARLAAAAPGDGRVRIGYFSGHPRVHDEDLALAGPALAVLLERFHGLTLALCGEVALPAELQPYGGRLERRPAVEWQSLPAEIARVDINIAPLVDNPQRRGKSAVKYLEAALLGVPTVAARLEPFTGVIAEGRTGMLAGPTEWEGALAGLIADAQLRRRIGAAARAHVLAEHTTAARAPALAAIVRQCLESRG
jgi:glycosyltransferase involved in cell wall biosynthesis